jgi:beta-carotene hydroxylase
MTGRLETEPPAANPTAPGTRSVKTGTGRRDAEQRFDKPRLETLGLDLLQVSGRERALSLALPFLCAAGFFAFCALGWWVAAIACAVVQSFYTYASVSHDLVHGNLGLSRRVTEVALSTIELVSFRSGHAFRAAHLHHHARFPADDDLEGRAASWPMWRALAYGVIAQPRQYRWALANTSRRTRRWVAAEGLAAISLLAGCAIAWPWSPVPALYAATIIAGSWLYPFATSYLPHSPSGLDARTQTRLFRGVVLSILAHDHLYHLEHHLYPQVPHHRWRELALRLDPTFRAWSLPPLKLWK